MVCVEQQTRRGENRRSNWTAILCPTHSPGQLVLLVSQRRSIWALWSVYSTFWGYSVSNLVSYTGHPRLSCILYSKKSDCSKEDTSPKTREREREIESNLIRISWETFVLLKRMQGTWDENLILMKQNPPWLVSWFLYAMGGAPKIFKIGQ